MDSPQDKDKAGEAVNDYVTLVMHGKALKECGKILEALNCLVKALDIKSADPEVMLMSLSLYKQLNTICEYNLCIVFQSKTEYEVICSSWILWDHEAIRLKVREISKGKFLFLFVNSAFTHCFCPPPIHMF